MGTANKTGIEEYRRKADFSLKTKQHLISFSQNKLSAEQWNLIKNLYIR